jgi:uncharacterized ubiquitin-like protein YukD
MLRAIISIRREGDQDSRTFEVPAEVPAEQLAEWIAVGLGWERLRSGQPASYAIRVEATGQVLRGHETLADAAVWDGSRLALQPKTAPAEKVLRPACFESDAARSYPLPYAKMRVGRRAADSRDPSELYDLVDLRDEPDGMTVSRNHAMVIYTNGKWSLVPFGDTQNQTWVNGKLIDQNHPYQLRDGDRVEFGGVRLRFRLEEERK